MGGDRFSPPLSSADEDSSLEQEFQDYPNGLPALYRGVDLSSKTDDDTVIGEKGLMLENLDDVGTKSCKCSLCFQANRSRTGSVYCEVLRSYDELQSRTNSLEEAKLKILSYTPGKWTEKVGGMKLSDYNIPKTTSLLLIGPERSGKSSLINRISRVFDNDKFAPDRAQVSYNPDGGDGTYFLQEYMIPRGSTSFCLYDTRSLSDNESENTEMLKRWMTEGVRSGELVSRNSDCPNLKTRMKCKSHQNMHCNSKTRMVNFVIFVVSGLSVLNSMESDDEADEHNKMIATMFSCPFLSFRDDKPAVVITHGDLLSLSDRARVRVHLGKLLGIPPKKQIFDIPENCDPGTEMAIVDLIRHSLDHADKNLPAKGSFLGKISKVQKPGSLLVLILGIVLIWSLVHDVYFHNDHNHYGPQIDAPVGRNANDSRKADDDKGTQWTKYRRKRCTQCIHTVVSRSHILIDKSTACPADYSSDMSKQHAPQTYAPIGGSANNSLLGKDHSDMNIMNAPQTAAPIDKNDATRAEQSNKNAKSAPQVPPEAKTSGMNRHAPQTDAPTRKNDASRADHSDVTTGKNAKNAQQVTPETKTSSMKTRHDCIVKNDGAQAHQTDSSIDVNEKTSAPVTPETKGMNTKRAPQTDAHTGKDAGTRDEPKGNNARTSKRSLRRTRTSAHQTANDAANEGIESGLAANETVEIVGCVHGSLQLNNENVMEAGIGGFLTTGDIKVIYVFSGPTKAKSSVGVELRALSWIIKLMKQKGLKEKSILIYSNAKLVIKGIYNAKRRIWTSKKAYSELASELKYFDNCRISFQPREFNRVADGFANGGLGRKKVLHSWVNGEMVFQYKKR